MKEIKKVYATVSRRKMLEFLMANSNSTVSVSQVNQYLISEDCEVNVTTIYRYMDKLAKEGIVLKYVAQKGDMAVYQYVGENHECGNHLHLQCSTCGKIIHMDCEFMDEIAGHIEDHHDFKVQCKNSIIYGLCHQCR